MKFNIISKNVGYKEIGFGKDLNTTEFYQIAKRLSNILQITYFKKRENFNTLFWDFNFRNVEFILHYDWHHGITAYLRNKEESSDDELHVFEEMVSELQRYN